MQNTAYEWMRLTLVTHNKNWPPQSLPWPTVSHHKHRKSSPCMRFCWKRLCCQFASSTRWPSCHVGSQWTQCTSDWGKKTETTQSGRWAWTVSLVLAQWCQGFGQMIASFYNSEFLTRNLKKEAVLVRFWFVCVSEFVFALFCIYVIMWFVLF